MTYWEHTLFGRESSPFRFWYFDAKNMANTYKPSSETFAADINWDHLPLAHVSSDDKIIHIHDSKWSFKLLYIHAKASQTSLEKTPSTIQEILLLGVEFCCGSGSRSIIATTAIIPYQQLSLCLCFSSPSKFFINILNIILKTTMLTYMSISIRHKHNINILNINYKLYPNYLLSAF